MARIKKIWNEDTYKKFIKEGRGQGEGENYKPWIYTWEVPSKGRRTRTPGWKTNRLHHCLSDHETRYLYLLEWADDVIDIREQFPLLDLETAQTIASDMGLDIQLILKVSFHVF